MRTRAQRGRALERHEVADEDLSAPDRAVGAVARAVVDRSDGRALEAVLGEARGQMGVVVLDAGHGSHRRSSSANAVEA